MVNKYTRLAYTICGTQIPNSEMACYSKKCLSNSNILFVQNTRRLCCNKTLHSVDQNDYRRNSLVKRP